MSDLFQAHKKYIIGFVVAILVFLVLWLIIGSLFEDSISISKRNKARYDRESRRQLPNGVNIEDVRSQAMVQQERFEALQKNLHRKPDSRFTLEGVSDPDLHYNRLIESMELDMVEQLALRNIDVDQSLGRPASYPKQVAEFAWYLRGFDVVHQVLGHIRDTDDIYEGAIARVAKIEVRGPRKTSRSVSQRQYVTLHPVDFVIVGHPRALAVLLEQIARRAEDGKSLVLLESEFRSLDEPPGVRRRGSRNKDARDLERVEAKLVIASVDLAPDGIIAAKGVRR